MEVYIGLDVSLASTAVCVLGEKGGIVAEAPVASTPDALVSFMQKLPFEIVSVGLEAGPMSQWLHKGLTDAGFAAEVEAITAGLRRGGLAEGARAVSSRMLETLALVGDVKSWPQKINRYREAGIGLPCPFLFPAEQDEAGSVVKGVEALAG